jgi:hypothetical protein
MRIIRTTVAALATAAALSSFASPATAFSPELKELFGHFFECKILLLTDLEAHARECGGGVMPTIFQSLSERVEGGSAPITETPPGDSGDNHDECYDNCECDDSCSD